MSIQKKGHVAHTLGAIATAAASAAARGIGAQTEATAEKIKITVAALNANFAQYFAAEDKGYFKEEGLDVEPVVVGGVMATAALIAGSIHYSGSSSSAMTAILRGAPIKVILVGQSRPIYEMWSFDPAVKTFEDLKGKLIAVVQRGGTDEIAVRMILKAKSLPLARRLIPTAIGSISPPGRGISRPKGPSAENSGLNSAPARAQMEARSGSLYKTQCLRPSRPLVV